MGDFDGLFQMWSVSRKNEDATTRIRPYQPRGGHAAHGVNGDANGSARGHPTTSLSPTCQSAPPPLPPVIAEVKPRPMQKVFEAEELLNFNALTDPAAVKIREPVGEVLRPTRTFEPKSKSGGADLSAVVDHRPPTILQPRSQSRGQGVPTTRFDDSVLPARASAPARTSLVKDEEEVIQPSSSGGAQLDDNDNETPGMSTIVRVHPKRSENAQGQQQISHRTSSKGAKVKEKEEILLYGRFYKCKLQLKSVQQSLLTTIAQYETTVKQMRDLATKANIPLEEISEFEVVEQRMTCLNNLLSHKDTGPCTCSKLPSKKRRVNEGTSAIT